jgi:heat shock protein HspQ
MIAFKSEFEEVAEINLFKIGQLVRHVHYGYRGVIVAMDLHCKASDEWYKKNKTQPEKEQPWYHVIVDGSIQVTYAAQSSLVLDTNEQCIVHPWINVYFDTFEGDHYIRNEKAWGDQW